MNVKNAQREKYFAMLMSNHGDVIGIRSQVPDKKARHELISTLSHPDQRGSVLDSGAGYRIHEGVVHVHFKPGQTEKIFILNQL